MAEVIIFNSAKNRFEWIGANGQVLVVMPLDPGADTSDVPTARRGTPTPTMIANAQKYMQGDEAAGDALDEELNQYNTVASGGTQQQPGTPLSPQTATGQGGMLPSPQYLNEILNGIQSAVNLEDARQKLSLDEQKTNRELQRRGLPALNTTAPDAGLAGKLPATPEAISELASTNPQYLAVFNRLGGMPAAIELMRRGNILLAARDQLDQHDQEQTVHDRVSQLQAALDDLENERQDMILDPSQLGEEARVKMDAFDRRYQRDFARLKQAQEREIEKIRPGYGAWMQQGDQEAINRLPEGQRYQYNAASARFTPGMKIQIQPTDRTDPANPDQKQPVFPTAQPALNGGTPSFAGPASQPAMATPAQPSDQPPNPAPQGFRWVKEGAQWRLKEITEYEREPEAAGFSGGAFGGLPGFAGGGMFEGGAFGAGGGNNFTPPPTAGMAPGTGQPQRPYQAPNQLETLGVSRLPLLQGQAYQDALQAIEQGYEAERQALVDAHRRRMAMLVAERGLGPMSQPAQIEGGVTAQPGMANVGSPF